MKIFKNIIIVSLAVFMVSCGIDDSKKYVLSPDETLQAYINKDDIYPSEKIANILLCKDSSHYQLIDIRTPHSFAINHIPGAINVPAKDILDEKYYDIINQDEKINVLYGITASSAIDAYLMLKQLNFKNNKVVLGGFDFINTYIVDNYGIKTGVYDDEKPKYDFLRLVAGTNKPLESKVKKPEFDEKNKRVVIDFDEECPDLN